MGLFKDIVASYNGYSLDADGLPEIELLRYLSFENPLEPVDGRKKLVVVLVELRLMENLPGSRYTASDLLGRLQTLKNDLNREGRQAIFLEMKAYSGPIHQDGKTLLAIRELFKTIHSSYKNFEGTILVGSFPEASMVRSWPQFCQENGEDQYRVGLTPGQPRPFELILADLDGNWRSLYHSRVNADGYIFRITPSTIVTKNGSKVILTNSKIEKRTEVLEDVFWIQDAAYRFISPTQVELDMTCRDPEVSTRDKAAFNPIAKPDICVSRINARSIAVQPPSLRLLDAGGKPQEVANQPSISLRMEDWQRDPKLERTLLIQYFDRNHAFRTGRYSGENFRIGLIESGLGTYAANEGLEGLDGQKDAVLNANLLEFTKWLKKPMTFRVISTHADCHSTFLRQDEQGSLQTEAESGGRPWRWIQENGKYIPSFKGHYTGDLHLYRTLWENRQLAATPPSLMLHVGCDVAGVGHPEQTYSHSWYGMFQNATCLLFYANQLGVLCRTTWWNRGPQDFGKSMNATDTVLGDGWKKVSEWCSRDLLLAKQTTERKQSYIWNVIGDWTLQKFYPAWQYGRRINNVDSTPKPLTACAFKNKLYLFWKANDRSNRIYYSTSSDGVVWSNGRTINNVDSTPEALSACVFNNKLYLFWKANDSGNRIYYSVSSDGSAWTNGRRINEADSTPKAPAACVFNNKLYVFWKANDSGNRIYYSASHDGAFWPNGRRINEFDSTPEAVSTCVFNNKLYVAWKANDRGNRIYCSSSTDGFTWPNARRVNEFDSTPQTPAACVFNNHLYMFWKANDPGNRIYCSGSTNGTTWPNAHKINDFDSTPQAPAACVFNNHFYLFWKANDSGNRIYYSVNDEGHCI